MLRPSINYLDKEEHNLRYCLHLVLSLSTQWDLYEAQFRGADKFHNNESPATSLFHSPDLVEGKKKKKKQRRSVDFRIACSSFASPSSYWPPFIRGGI